MEERGKWAQRVCEISNITENITEIKQLNNLETDEESFMQLFNNFTRETTLHGIKNATNRNFFVLRRVFWGLLEVAMLAGFLFVLYNSATKYFEYEVNTLIKVNYLNEMEFPAVTLCNYNQIRFSIVGEAGETFSRLYYPIRGTAEASDDQVLAIIDHMGGSNNSAKDLFIAAAHQIEDMVIECFWQKHSKCSHEDFKLIFTEFGICYTFNHAKNDSLRVQHSGSTSGLFLRLNVQQEEYLSSPNTGSGFRVYLHRPSELPLPGTLGFSISPGFETLIGVKYIQYRNLPKPFKSACKRKKLNYVETYTKGACDLECKSDYIMEKCGCQNYVYPGEYKNPCITGTQYKCILNTEENFTKEYSEYCDCPLPCEYVTYEPRISTAYWPSEYISKVLIDQYNLSKTTNLRINYLDLLIYFDELSYEEISQVQEYTPADFQSDIGGFLGLFLGASMLTIIEFFDFFIEAVAKKTLKYNHKNK